MNKRRIAILLLIIMLAAVVGCELPHFAFLKKRQQEKAKNALLERGVMNILLIGIDARPGEEKARSDTLILLSVDTDKKKAALLSIPRDTRMKEGDHYVKINSYNFEGGPELAREKVEELLGVPVHYYVLTNFTGFKDIVDTLGGVTVDVEKRMYKISEGINLKPGLQRLNGHDALAYCRFRSDALGDIGRTERQQKFLKALAAEMAKPETVAKLPRLIPEVRKYVKTDIPVTKLYALARMADSFKDKELVCQTLPGWFWTDPDTGASYWVVNEEKLPGILEKVLGGETMAVIEDSPYPELAREKRRQIRKDEAKTEPAITAQPTAEPIPEEEAPAEVNPLTPDTGQNTGDTALPASPAEGSVNTPVAPPTGEEAAPSAPTAPTEPGISSPTTPSAPTAPASPQGAGNEGNGQGSL